MGALAGELNIILADYEARGRAPHMVLEVIAGLTHEVEEELGFLPAGMENIGQIVTGWEQGGRLDHDALQTIAKLVRQG